MPLKAPRRLPRRMNRQTSVFSRSIANRYYQAPDRKARRRKEQRLRISRKMARWWQIILSEFRLWLLIGIAGVIVSTILVLLLAPFFDVRQIHIRRQDPRVDLEQIQQSLGPLFGQRLLLVTKGQVTSLLEPQYPDIDRIDIAKDYPSTLTVTMYLEPVAALVKIDDSELSATSQTGALVGSGAYSYITRSGFFVSSPIAISSTVAIPTLRFTDWGIRPQNRTRALSPDFVERIFSARDSLRTDFGLVTTDITVYVRAQEFHIRTNKVTLWFDLTSPLSVQFQRFREFLKTLSLDQVKEYIDLRIADKIIYK